MINPLTWGASELSAPGALCVSYHTKAMSQENGHWYKPDGTPLHFIPKKDGSGNRPTTLADARKLNLLPSVTTVLKCLAKPALTEWLIEQNVLAAVTTPRREGEGIDEFVKRVMSQDAQAETDAARDRGTEMHAALELLFQGRGAEVAPEVLPWVQPAYEEISKRRINTPPVVESVVVGDGYAGKVDLQQEERDGNRWLWDWKTTKKLPKCAYNEAVMQLSAYAKAVCSLGGFHSPTQLRTGNVYISTTEQGKFVVCEHSDWQETYERGFKPLLTLWQFLNQYTPQLACETK